jgi:hypothetical protein
MNNQGVRRRYAPADRRTVIFTEYQLSSAKGRGTSPLLTLFNDQSGLVPICGITTSRALREFSN